MKPAHAVRSILAAVVAAGLVTVPGSAGAQVTGADLAVDKADSPDPATSGSPITYVVTVDNDGPETATNVEVEDVLPVSSTFVSAVPSQGTCSQVLPVVTCNLGSLADEAVATVTIVITHAGTGTINDVAGAESSVLDPNPLNNVATETTTVTGGGEGTDLRVEKADAPDPVAPGATLTYVATVANVGSEDVTGVILTDILPLGVQFVSATASQGSCSAPVVVLLTCQIGAVADDGAATVTIVVRPSVEGTIANTITAAGSAPDPNPGNNLSTATTTVSAQAGTPGGGGTGGGKGGGGQGLAACTILGTPLDDQLTGTEQNDIICGLDGNDVMVGLGGKDVLIGGKDNDKGNGGKGPDTLEGQSGKDKLRGAAKRDRLSGGGSKDRLAGGPGKDRINGGAGKDRCSRGRGDKITKCP
jgi:uncharacterized repeat protein (TIGR01451 family)